MSQELLHGGAKRLPVRYLNKIEGQARVSRYEVAPGAAVSLHVHTGKIESWVIVAGAGTARIGAQSFDVVEGDILTTQAGEPHALENTATSPLIFLNIVHQIEGVDVTTTELED